MSYVRVCVWDGLKLLIWRQSGTTLPVALFEVGLVYSNGQQLGAKAKIPELKNALN